MPHLFNLGLYQKRMGGDHKITAAPVNLGNTRGNASATRIFNYCRQRSSAPSLCINQFAKFGPSTNIQVNYNNLMF